jgi:hypothetical protein
LVQTRRCDLAGRASHGGNTFSAKCDILPQNVSSFLRYFSYTLFKGAVLYKGSANEIISIEFAVSNERDPKGYSKSPQSLHIEPFWKILFINPPEVPGQVVQVAQLRVGQ